MDYKTVLIVGNGFDLNLGLKTSYDDFMNSEEFSRIKKDSFLVTYLKKNKGRGLWIDIENELSIYSYKLYSHFGSVTKPVNDAQIQKLRSEYIELCAALSQYLRKATAVEISRLDEKVAFKTFSKIKKIEPAYILNFNYTDIVERINDFYPTNTNKIKINHIHGSLEKEIVFGVEDTAKVEKDHVFLYKSYNQCNNIQGLHSMIIAAKGYHL